MPRQNARILTFGADISLLSSRINLLTQAGYVADFETDMDRLGRRVRSSRYHLVLVESSFNQDEQISIRAKLKKANPQLPVLLLTDQENDGTRFLRVTAAFLDESKRKLTVGPFVTHLFDQSRFTC